jgi:glycyl-tRNA synthetase
MSPKVWEASGHTQSFTDVLVDCKNCKLRTRADHLLESVGFKGDIQVNKSYEGLSEEVLQKEMETLKPECPKCGKSAWTKPRKFNLLFETHIGIVPENQSLAYLRGEIAQGMFVNFANVLDTMRPKLPFGIAQAGKAFRNEITLGNFIFRTLEFNLAEFEYFIDPRFNNWEEIFAYWKKEMQKWIESLGVDSKKLKWRTHTDQERAHYSSKTEDLDYEFSFGFKEMFGLAYRTDYDLKNHIEKSGANLYYTDPQTGEKVVPHVVEPTFGINRVFLTLLDNGYYEDGDRVVLKLDKKIAPYRAAVFPLLRNKEEIVAKAKSVYTMLVNSGVSTAWDDRGNIGKRYLSQDEIGTPSCITIDFQTLEDDTVTIRNRDTTEQIRVAIKDIIANC